MIGVLLGASCGAVELILLLMLVNRVTSGETIPIWLVPAKMFAMAVFFVPCAFFAKNQLHWAGISAALVLMLGAGVQFIRKSRKQQRSAANRVGGDPS